MTELLRQRDRFRMGSREWSCHALFLLLGLALLLPSQSMAAVSGPCSNCHTMHYSQGGTVLAEWGPSGPYSALLTNDCASCHTGVNNGTHPYVTATTVPAYNASGSSGNALAGGSFYWVNQASGDSRGHNVDILGNADATLSVPPGFAAGRAAADSSTVANSGNCSRN